MSLSLESIAALKPVERRKLVREALTAKFGAAAKSTGALHNAWGDDPLTSSSLYFLINNPAGFFSPQTSEYMRARVFQKLWPENVVPQASQNSAPAPRKSSRVKEPEDKNSFGYLLWQILGGPKMDSKLARDNLKINSASLSQMLHGRNIPSAAYIERQNWRNILNEKYPETWAEHQAAFEEKIASRPAPQNVFQRARQSGHSKQTNDGSQATTPEQIARWRSDVSQFIAQFCEAKGDSPEDLEPEITSILLRKHWRAVVGLQPMPATPLPNSLFIEAINALSRLYSLQPNAPRAGKTQTSAHDWAVFKLLARAPI